MVAAWFPGGDEVLAHIRVFVPPSGGQCRGYHTSVVCANYLVASTRAVLKELMPMFWVTDVLVDGVVLALFQGLRFLGRCMFRMVLQLRFGLGYPSSTSFLAEGGQVNMPLRR